MILFLDFDGVLHKYGCKPADLFGRLPLLEAWLGQQADVNVVVSSTWRLTRTLDEIRSFFSPAIQPRIVGVTPRINGALPERFPREAEVAMWLRGSDQPWQPWVALDDHAWLFRPFNDRVVLCDPYVGLTEDDLVRLSAVLGGRA
ncbi:HAD domain-containing protein [Caldimonas tepidiphila]|uniref:HAD domain-containing protein n=1 Tax=Caldimonas tepidiphila TaxID=2315841 RepID=UPI000E5BE481|nr:HAD domain-containing protein [Caldimonas tepidiphila]